MSRPENQIPAELFYGVDSARKYSHSSRVQYIQRKMTVRAMELMNLPSEAGCCHLLDIGCGGGIAGEVIEQHGHTWTGTDISMPMLQVAREREAADEDSDADEEEYGEVERDCPRPMVEVARSDMGHNLPFRAGSFDGAISISAIQWLCVSEKKGDVPQKRIKTFFQSLVGVLRRGAKAVLQFYPENTTQLDMLSTTALRCGFDGGVVVDFPHSTRAKKYYLVLSAGKMAGGYRPAELALQQGGEDFEDDGEGWQNEDSDEEAQEIEDDDDENWVDEQEDGGRKRARVERRNPKDANSQMRKRRRIEKMKSVAKARPKVGTKTWVLMKKEQRTKRGKTTAATSKFANRRRKPRF